MPNLIELATKYGTDKLEHGYIPFYEQHLPKNPKRILEIGVKEGKSLAMWAEYFPEAEIHGLDLFQENDISDVNNFLQVRVLPNQTCALHKGNQCDWRVLELLRKFDFDVIIDDGSHNARDQMMTFFGLFNGRHYFIEDLHCNDDEFYSQGLPEDLRAYAAFPYIGNYLAEYSDEEVKVTQDENGKIICIHAYND
jgi:hypothetical protein